MDDTVQELMEKKEAGSYYMEMKSEKMKRVRQKV